MTLQSTLPGISFNYYGNEIGMTDNPNVSIPRKFRTPMQWNSEGTGFSKNKPWVPRNPNYFAVNVEVLNKIHVSRSMFLISLRSKIREHNVFVLSVILSFRICVRNFNFANNV